MVSVHDVDACLTLIGGFIVMTICSGTRRSMGLMFLEIIEMCNVERSKASFTVSCYFVTSMACAPISTWMQRRFGGRFVIALGGLIASCALLCASFVRRIEVEGRPGIVVVSTDVDSVASGTALDYVDNSENGICRSVLLSDTEDNFSSILRPFHCHKDSRTTVLAKSVSMLNMDLVEKNDYRTGSEPLSLRRVFRQLVFYEINFCISFALFTQALSFFIIPPFAEDIGIGRVYQSLILLLAGIPDIIGRIGIGLLCDHFQGKRLQFLFALQVMGAVNWTVISIWPCFASITVFTLISSIICASIMTMVTPIVIDLLGHHVLDVSMATLDATEACLLLAAPPMMSLIRERSGSWMCGIYCGVGCFIVSIAVFVRQIRDHVFRCRR